MSYTPAKLQPGVYAIGNAVNGKLYVGSSSHIQRRLNAHKSELRRGVSGCGKLQRAWNKYGEKSFEFHVVKRCEVDQLIDEEQRLIECLDAVGSGYNSRKVAASNRGLKISEEQKKTISAANKRWQTPEFWARMRSLRAAKLPAKPPRRTSEQWASDMRQKACANRKSGTISQFVLAATTRKLSESQVTEILRIYRDGNISIRRLAANFSIGYSTVRRILSGKNWAWVNTACRGGSQ
jgi:group I intron endonuclease